MPFIAFQAVERRHRLRAAIQEIGDGEIAEIHARQRRGQPQSDIGRRGSLRDLDAQRQLRIIRRQPVRLGVDQIVEVAPGPARQAAEEVLVLDADPVPL